MEADASNTLILWIAITACIIAAACFAGDWWMNRKRNRFTSKNERYYRKHGTRIPGRL